MNAQTYKTLIVEQHDIALHVTLNRPQARNAMSLEMVGELRAVFDHAAQNSASIRAIVLRGADGHFCAGGDISDMVKARQTQSAEQSNDAYFRLNRAFGEMLLQAHALPVPLIVVAQGTVLGGGMGLVCVADLVLADASAKFGLPETSLGLPPAQIAPFVVQRIGAVACRKMALFGLRCSGQDAVALGLIDQLCTDLDALENALGDWLEQLRRCAPGANAVTKALIRRAEKGCDEALLDQAARHFADAVSGAEGQEGTLAFMQKRAAKWAQKLSAQEEQ